MIIFHEGLPRSGKSYEAVVEHVIPALKSGREVWSNVEGLYDGAEKIAGLIGSDTETVQSMIHQLESSEMMRLHELLPKDVLVLYDEVQNEYPSDRRNISIEERKYIAEHGHYGHDIVLMGQNFNDINKLWRNRTQRKITFAKRTAVGRPNEYTWTAYEAQISENSEVKFSKIASGGKKYDPKYFGTYRSHSVDTSNKSMNYEDDRTNIFKQKNIIYGVPIFLILVIFAIRYLVGFLDGSHSMINTAQAGTHAQEIKNIQTPKIKPVANIAPNKPIKKVFVPVDYLDDLANKYKLRLAGSIYDSKGIIKVAFIDVLDSSFHKKERFTVADIRALGWNIQQKEYGLDITKEDRLYVIRPFPIDVFGKVNKQLSDSL